jgi:hypothetical protein
MPVRGHIRNLNRRPLYRLHRVNLYRYLAQNWKGSRNVLRRIVREILKLVRKRLKIVDLLIRETRPAALAAGILVSGLHGSIQAAPPINLLDIAMDIHAGGFVINGINVSDQSGQRVSGAGDVNGDGLADVIIGARYADPTDVQNAGESYVVFGKASGISVNLADVAAGIGGFVINGIDVDDRSGSSVSGAGDINGDGLADLIAGAQYADPGGIPDAGESYVIFGKSDGGAVNLGDVAAGTGGFVINGIDTGDQSGRWVSGAADVNGDGLADVIVGAHFADPNGNLNAGECYVIFGKSDGGAVNLGDVAAGTGGFVINGIDAGDQSGRSVSGAGDVNGDGLADLVIGARYADPAAISNAGESYVIFGRAGTNPVNLNDVAAGTGGFVINGIDQEDYSGVVSGAGDVNGDGLADLIIGVTAADPGGLDKAGESYVVFGRTDGNPIDLADVAAGTGGFVITGIDEDDRSGIVSGAGDINGDGLADLIIGALQADPAGNSRAGESYVVFGRTSTGVVSLGDIAAGNGGFVINGIDVDDYSGVVSGVGDVNGDGLADLVIGAFYADPGGNDGAGESYVVFSPEIPEPSGTYRMATLAGDGAGGMAAPITDFGDTARVRIDFSDEDMGMGGGLAGASREVATITRSGSGILNLADAADVLWEITSDRTNFNSAEITLKYLESEISSLPVGETNLVIHKADSAAGPWIPLTTSRQTERNKLRADTDSFSLFALAPTPTPTPTPTPVPQDIEVDPSSLDFESQVIDLGPTQAQNLTLSNSGEVDLTFTGDQIILAGPNAPEFSITGDTMESMLGSGGMRTVTLNFDPSDTGSKSASLRITSDDPDEPAVDIALVGIGLGTGLVSDPRLIDQGARQVDGGTTPSMQVTITNISGSSIELATGGVILVGDDVTAFPITSDTGEAMLDLGASRVLVIAFDPASVGAKAAMLRVSREGAVSPSLVVALVGTGIQGYPSTVTIDALTRFILGFENDPSGLDINNDSVVDVADVATSLNDFAPMSAQSPTPDADASGIGLNPTFNWTDEGTRSQSFDFELFNDEGFSLTLKGLTTNSVTLNEPLGAGTTYRWRVTSHNRAGATSGPVWSFTTEP